MWVKFTKDFDFSPAARKGAVTIAYKAGMEQNVTRECYEAALAVKKAQRLKRTAKPDAETDSGQD